MMPSDKATRVVKSRKTRNIKVKNKAAVVLDEEVKTAIKEIETLIAGKGRVLLRESGTEPVIRIMIECEDKDKCVEYSEKIANVITQRGYAYA